MPEYGAGVQRKERWFRRQESKSALRQEIPSVQGKLRAQGGDRGRGLAEAQTAMEKATAMMAATAFVVALTLNASVFAQSCDDDSIESVSDDGAIIVMMSGAVFRVNPADQVDTALWLPADDVLICNHDTEIINTDENGERAAVSRLH